MSLAHPWAVALAALSLPIIAAYLHKLHRDRQLVASAILLRVIRDERPASRRSRSKLRHRISLALLLAALLAALFALVGPHASAEHVGRVVIVLDRSASMATRDGEADRLTHAARAVGDIAERANDSDEVALVAAGGDPAVEVAPTRNHGDVATAALAVARRGAVGDNRQDALAFRLADGLCKDPSNGRIVVVSDGAGMVVPQTRCPVESRVIGRDAENLGIAGMSVRALDGLGMYDVHLAVASSSPKDRHVEVTLTADGEVVDVVTLEVPLHGDAERTVRVTIDHGHTLVATLPGGDANPLDDRAEVALSDAGPVSVLLVTSKKNSMVAEALQLHPRVQLTIAAPGALPPDPRDLIILESDPAGKLPPAAHVVALGVSPGGDAPIELAGTVASRAVVRWDFDAPWFRYVDLHDLVVSSGRLVAGGHSVVDTGAGPLVATAPWGNRELVVTGFTVDETDLTLRAAFPNLIANLIDWAGPKADTTPPRGVLSSAESHVAPRPLPGQEIATAHKWTDPSWLARLAVLLAIALLIAEQLLYVRRQPLR
ncbi:MAG TPA: VWA domain-containing protein [Kofleriaceae bacterium]|nr:VWA domain-containing protein [Kofleriaceae bacterium]